MAKRGYVSEGDLAEVIPCVLYKLKAWLSMADSSAFPWCRLGWSWATCPTAVRIGCCKRTSFRCRCPLARACNIIIFVWFSAENLTLWVPFYPPIAHLAAKKRFSRGFVLMQKGGRMCVQQNGYLFQENLICTRFRAICSKMHCVLMQNRVRFGAK